MLGPDLEWVNHTVEVVQDDTQLGLNKKVTIELHLKEQAGIG